MKRYTAETVSEHEAGAFILHSDHEAALKAAVAAAETRVHEQWADAVSKHASMHVVMAITREMNRGAAHD